MRKQKTPQVPTPADHDEIPELETGLRERQFRETSLIRELRRIEQELRRRGV